MFRSTSMAAPRSAYAMASRGIETEEAPIRVTGSRVETGIRPTGDWGTLSLPGLFSYQLQAPFLPRVGTF